MAPEETIKSVEAGGLKFIKVVEIPLTSKELATLTRF
jgi:hypothetical protein